MANTSSTPTALISERQDALARLLKDYGQGPDGKYTFGYGGHVYTYDPTAGINSDGTINVFDVTANQKGAPIDPLDVVAANSSQITTQLTNNNTLNNNSGSSAGTTLLSLLQTGTGLYGQFHTSNALSKNQNAGSGGSGGSAPSVKVTDDGFGRISLNNGSTNPGNIGGTLTDIQNNLKTLDGTGSNSSKALQAQIDRLSGLTPPSYTGPSLDEITNTNINNRLVGVYNNLNGSGLNLAGQNLNNPTLLHDVATNSWNTLHTQYSNQYQSATDTISDYKNGTIAVGYTSVPTGNAVDPSDTFIRVTSSDGVSTDYYLNGNYYVPVSNLYVQQQTAKTNLDNIGDQQTYVGKAETNFQDAITRAKSDASTEYQRGQDSLNQAQKIFTENQTTLQNAKDQMVAMQNQQQSLYDLKNMLAEQQNAFSAGTNNYTGFTGSDIASIYKSGNWQPGTGSITVNGHSISSEDLLVAEYKAGVNPNSKSYTPAQAENVAKALNKLNSGGIQLSDSDLAAVHSQYDGAMSQYLQKNFGYTSDQLSGMTESDLYSAVHDGLTDYLSSNFGLSSSSLAKLDNTTLSAMATKYYTGATDQSTFYDDGNVAFDGNGNTVVYNDDGSFTTYAGDGTILDAPDPLIGGSAPQFNTFYKTAQSSALKNVLTDDMRADLKSSEIKAGISLVSSFGTGYGFEQQLEGMWTNGFSWKSFGTTVGLFAGFAGSLHVLNGAIGHMLTDWKTMGTDATGMVSSLLNNTIGHGLLHVLSFLSTLGGTALLTGLLVLVSRLATRTSNDAAQAKALIDEISPNVWSDGPVLMLTAGLTLSSMGINMGPSAPLEQTMTAPQSVITAALSTATGGQMPSDDQRYGAVFVMQSQNGGPVRVAYISQAGTDAKGHVLETLNVETLGPNVTFQNPGSGAFIPFNIKLSNGKTVRNPAVRLSLQNENALGKCATTDSVTTTTAEACAAAGGQWSHNGSGS